MFLLDSGFSSFAFLGNISKANQQDREARGWEYFLIFDFSNKSKKSKNT